MFCSSFDLGFILHSYNDKIREWDKDELELIVVEKAVEL